MSVFLLSSLLVLMLIFAFLGDLLQYAVRIISSAMNQPNLSTHLVTLTMLINRFGAALALLIIGFMIDIGVSIRDFLSIYILFVLILGISYLLKAKFPNFGLKLTIAFITRYYAINCGNALSYKAESQVSKVKPSIAIIFSISLLGFLLPSLLASAFPDYRATLLQSGFILNSIATLYSALKIEKNLTLTMNDGNNDDKWFAYCEFMKSRAIGCIIAAVIFITIGLFTI